MLGRVDWRVSWDGVSIPLVSGNMGRLTSNGTDGGLLLARFGGRCEGAAALATHARRAQRQPGHCPFQRHVDDCLCLYVVLLVSRLQVLSHESASRGLSDSRSPQVDHSPGVFVCFIVAAGHIQATIQLQLYIIRILAPFLHHLYHIWPLPAHKIAQPPQGRHNAFPPHPPGLQTDNRKRTDHIPRMPSTTKL